MMRRETILQLLQTWDPASEDLPDEVALAIDADPTLRRALDARFLPTALPQPDVMGLERRVLEGVLGPRCPFCEDVVSASLLRFGGACPQCFGEIPGEDSATDPGAEVRQRHAAEDRTHLRRARRWSTWGASVGALAVMATAAAALLWPAPHMATLDLDGEAYGDVELAFLSAEERLQPVEPAPARTLEPRRPSAGRSAPEGPSAVAVAVPLETQPRLGGDDAASSARPLQDSREGLFGEGAFATRVERNRGEGVTLQDDDAIIAMVQRVMREELRRVRSCYNGELKADETLSGSWVMSFTIARDGHTKRVSVVPKATEVPRMEQCIKSKIEAWQFQPIYSELPVRKTLSFRPM